MHVGIGPALVEMVDDIQEGAQRQRQGQHDKTTADIAYDGDQGFREIRDGADAERDHQRRYDIGEALDDAEVLQGGIPIAARDTVQAAHQDALDHPVGQPGNEDQQHRGVQGLQLGAVAEPVPPRGNIIEHGQLHIVRLSG